MSDAVIPPTRMTVAEYQALPESNRHMELIHGELITTGDEAMSPAPKDAHQKTVLAGIICLAQRIPGGSLRTAPTDVHLGLDTVLQPDIFWVSDTNNLCQLGADDYWYGAPDLVVEVLSPSTALRDRGVKFNLYQQHGVREYWLVDSEARFVEVYHLKKDTFVRAGIFGAADTFNSSVLNGASIPTAALFGN